MSDIADLMEDRGFPKQAALMRSSTGDLYQIALTNTHWRSHVTQQLGSDLTQRIVQERGSHNIPKRSVQNIEYPSLFIKADETLTPEQLSNASESADTLIEECAAIHGTIGQAARRAFDHDPSLASRAYRDYDRRSMGNAADLSFQEYKQKLTDLYNQACEDYSQDEHRIIHLGCILSDMIRHLEPYELAATRGNDAVYDHHFAADFTVYIGDPTALKRFERRFSQYVKKLEHTLADEHKLAQCCALSNAFNRETEDERLLHHAYRAIDRCDPAAIEMALPNPFSRESLSALAMEYPSHTELQSGQASPEDIMHTDINIRKTLVEEWNALIDQLHNIYTGCLQILEGGPATNPELDPLSNLHNDAEFPNITYPEDTMRKIRRFTQAFEEHFKKLPDLDDLTLSDKVKRKTEFSYSIQELEKDPLDVTFGNDAGCCLAIHETSDIGNAEFIPLYLMDPAVRLFGVYQRTGESKQRRVGFMLAFDSYTKDDRPALASNSLELTKTGIKGGHRAKREIVDYVEDYLAQYAHENGYEAAYMGDMGYNIARQLSSRPRNNGPDLFLPVRAPFYSDIFHPLEDTKTMKAPGERLYKL